VQAGIQSHERIRELTKLNSHALPVWHMALQLGGAEAISLQSLPSTAPVATVFCPNTGPMASMCCCSLWLEGCGALAPLSPMRSGPHCPSFVRA
jgi:hypothetical protein